MFWGLKKLIFVRNKLASGLGVFFCLTKNLCFDGTLERFCQNDGKFC